MTRAVRVGLAFDLRAWDRSHEAVYRDTLDLIVEAERAGIDAVKVTEHHLFADGYIPQPLTFLAAVAARTSTIRLATGILQAPLHSAVEIAEQSAIVDCLSGGRLELGLGLGYRRPEYDLYGMDYAHRLRIYEETVRRVTELWREGGVTPPPVQDPVPLWAGLAGEQGSRLAGRLGMGRLHFDRLHWSDYLDGLADAGLPQSAARLGGSLQAMLASDPDRAFAELAPAIEHNRLTYARYGVEGTGLPDPSPYSAEELKAAAARARAANSTESGQVIVDMLTPGQAVDAIDGLAGDRPVDVIYLAGSVSGVVDDLAYENVRLVADELKPLLGAASKPAQQER